MGWLILIVVLLIMFKVVNTQNIYKKQLENNPNLIETYIPIYAGGLGFVTGGRQVILSINNDNINLNFNTTKDTDYPEVTIDYKDISNVSIKTETQIQKDISIGGLLTLGALHLATKRTRNVYSNFLIIEYTNNGEKNYVLLAHQYLQRVYNNITNQIKLTQNSTI